MSSLLNVYRGLAVRYAVIGQQGEIYETWDNGDGTSLLKITFFDAAHAPKLEMTIDHWRPGDFGIRLATDKAYDTNTGGNKVVDTVADVSPSVILAALTAENLISRVDNAGPTQPATTNTGPGLTRQGNTESNILTGTSSNDVLRGDQGNDSLAGGDGADAYVFAAGDGQDALSDTAGQNIIRFVSAKGSGAIDLGQVQAANVLGASGSHDLVLTYGTSDTVTIEGFFDHKSSLGWVFVGSDGIDQTAAQFLTQHGISPTIFDPAGANVAPVASDAAEAVTGGQDGAIVGNLLAGTDADGDAMLFQLIDGSASHGQVTLDALTGKFVFTPDAGFVGQASFQYQVGDGLASSAPKTVTIDVAHVNHRTDGAAVLGRRHLQERPGGELYCASRRVRRPGRRCIDAVGNARGRQPASGLAYVRPGDADFQWPSPALVNDAHVPSIVTATISQRRSVTIASR